MTRDKKSSCHRLLFVRSKEVKDAEDILFLGCGAHGLRAKVRYMDRDWPCLLETEQLTDNTCSWVGRSWDQNGERDDLVLLHY